MTGFIVTSVLSLSLLLPTALALPPFWPHHGWPGRPDHPHGCSEPSYPSMTISSSAGVYPTGFPGATGTGTGVGTGTGYYPTATGSAYLLKREPGRPEHDHPKPGHFQHGRPEAGPPGHPRPEHGHPDPDHPFGYPPPHQPDCSSTGISTPTGAPTNVPSYPTYTPTGSAPSASGTGTGLAYPTYGLSQRDIDDARQAHREHFEGPRRHGVHPYFPYHESDDCGYGGTAGPTATGVAPTGTGVIPLPMPTGTVSLPAPSGTVGSGYYSTV